METWTTVELGGDYAYSESRLGDIVTFAEACSLWGKSKGAMLYAIKKRRIAFRRSLPVREAAGKNTPILITVRSLICLWGEPNSTVLEQLYQPKGIDREKEN